MTTNSDLKIDYVDITHLKPYERNAKIHTKKQVAKIVQSMKTFGVVTPILTNKDYEVIAGHGRLEALKELGYTKVPVIMLEHLSESLVKAYRLADNKIAQDATYDEELLKIELQELIISDEVVITDTGFDIADIDEIIIDGYGEQKDKSDKADEIEDVSKIEKKVNAGDLWKLGKHLLLCGDSLNIESYKALMNNEKAGLVLMDAPYNVKIQGHVCGKGKTKHKEFAMASGEMSDAQFENFVCDFMTNLIQFSKNGSLHYLFIDWRGLKIFLNSGAKFYADLKNICIWNKMNGGMGSLYRSQYEAICVLKNGTSPHINNVELGKNGRYRTNVWNHKGVSATNPKSLELLKLHPTVKPVGLLHEVLLDASAPNDIVLDCFGGSGSTLLACEQAKRNARLIEIDPQYCNVAIYRWEKLTGNKAEFIRNVNRQRKEDKMKPEDNEKQYEVGYKKPPKNHQFKKGQSGNPKGRPKLIRDFKTDLKVELESTITVQIDGKPKPITKQQALIKKLLSKALNGELGALKTLTNFIALHLKVSEADIDELLDEDVKLFDKYYVERKGGKRNDN